jgi:hypothetical protein
LLVLPGNNHVKWIVLRTQTIFNMKTQDQLIGRGQRL